MTKPLTSDRGVGQGGNVLYVFDDDVISFYSIRNKMTNNENNYWYAKFKQKIIFHTIMNFFLLNIIKFIILLYYIILLLLYYIIILLNLLYYVIIIIILCFINHIIYFSNKNQYYNITHNELQEIFLQLSFLCINKYDYSHCCYNIFK